MEIKQLIMNKTLKKIISTFTGVAAKGQPANYPSKGELQIQSTCMPDEKENFNSWANNIKRAIG
jgi:hypothetical protein